MPVHVHKADDAFFGTPGQPLRQLPEVTDYYAGMRDVWVCLSNPTADYPTLYAEHAPQQVTHPVKDVTDQPVEIKPQGMSLNGILAAVCVVTILSAGFLWSTRKKK